MRIKVILQKQYSKQACIVPRDYYYYLASIIYKKLEEGNPSFAQKLHNQGYSYNNNSFKLFSFSPLKNQTNAFTIYQDKIIFTDFPLSFTCSTLINEFSTAFIMGLFKNKQIIIEDKFSKTHLKVLEIVQEKEPEFSQTMKYKLESPVIVKSKNEQTNKTEFISPQHKDFTKIIIENLQKKYSAFALQNNIEIDQSIINNINIEILEKTQKSKKIMFKNFAQKNVNFRGYFFNFILTAPIEIQKIAYYAGIGKSNALGFGYLSIHIVKRFTNIP